MRRSAPISGGGAEVVKRLDECFVAIYRQVTLPSKEAHNGNSGVRRDQCRRAEDPVPDRGRAVRRLSRRLRVRRSRREGVLTWTIEGTPIDVGPGEALCIPRGAVHQFDNAGDVDAKALAVVTPGILGPDYFREVAAILDAAPGGPPDFAALGEVMRRHGLTCAE